ncbi:hypothetical protein KJA15_02990 [Patescibacteria group bacterium]|nr:hypothetical protein [Patescibacteria group bacterium]
MEQIISKEEFNELMKIEGEVKEEPLKTTLEFVLKEKGKEGLKKLEDTMAKLGYPIKYQEIRSRDLYPIGLMAITLLVIKRLFNFNEEKFREMGRFEAKISSLIIRVFMKFFVSLERMAKATPKMWKRHFTVGDLKTIELNKEKRYAILRLKNFRLHPLHCQALIGYFSSVVEMIVRSKATCEETKCPFRGDEYHEFLVKWQ